MLLKERGMFGPRSLIHPVVSLFTLLVCSLTLTLPLPAQSPTAVVTGTVVDVSGGPIPDATVTVVNQATNVRSQKKTAADGTFTILNLLPGEYVLTVQKEGFKTAGLPPFKLDVNQTL